MALWASLTRDPTRVLSEPQRSWCFAYVPPYMPSLLPPDSHFRFTTQCSLNHLPKTWSEKSCAQRCYALDIHLRHAS